MIRRRRPYVRAARAGASSTAGDTVLAPSKLLRCMVRMHVDLAVRAQQAMIGQGIAEVDALVSLEEETSGTSSRKFRSIYTREYSSVPVANGPKGSEATQTG